jgi:hypothetical protein
MLNAIMLIVVMLSVTMLTVLMLSVIILNVVAPLLMFDHGTLPEEEGSVQLTS